MIRLLVLTAVAALATTVPATAATPTAKGTVGPGFTIKLVKAPKRAGKAKIVVTDRSSDHNFHLKGRGVNVKTSVDGTGKKTFTVTLRKGVYRFICDPHASSMKGSFRVR